MTARYRYDAVIRWPLAVVSDVARNRVSRLAAYLPEVESVVDVDVVAEGDLVTIRRRWRLGPSALPGGLAGLLPDDALGFEDTLTWDHAHRARFVVSPLIHADAVAFSGVARLQADGADTLLDVEGAFELLPAAVERLPPALRQRGVAAVESAVVAAVRMHLGRACGAIERLLDDEA